MKIVGSVGETHERAACQSLQTIPLGATIGWKRQLAGSVNGLFTGCISQITYQPNEHLVETLGNEEVQHRLEETLSHAIRPRISDVTASNNMMEYRYQQGANILTKRIFYTNAARIEVYVNNVVFVRTSANHLLDQIVFGNAEDARLYADLIHSLRTNYLQHRFQQSASDSSIKRTSVPSKAQPSIKPEPIPIEKVPLAKVGGVYTLPVILNGVLALNFILDTGASEVVIPADVALTLIRTGTIQDSDFLPGADYALADGSMVSSPRFTIRSLRIGHREITNVSASIGQISSYLLIGHNVLERFGAWGIDNKNKVLMLGMTDAAEEDKTNTAISLTGNWQGAWHSSRYTAKGALAATFVNSGITLKGRAIITDSACFANGEMFGTVIGEVIVLRANFGHDQWADLTGTISSDGMGMGGQYIINGGQCGGDAGIWSFQRK